MNAHDSPTSNQCVHDFVCIECGTSLDDAQQPLGWMTEDGQMFVSDELKLARPDDFRAFSIAVPRATAPPAESRGKWHIFNVCTAYESGLGHGAAGDGLPNPYRQGTEAFEAYQIGVDAGYAEGKRGAAVTKASAPPADDAKQLLREAAPYIESFAQLTKHPTAPADARVLIDRIYAYTNARGAPTKEESQ